mmetsp:Transcript_4152/g.10042  ORF Transcript_4152/g.10042 Transcript_4152/m.10042 type:complete len:100 (-) Transcript_4152:549-848(-)
MCSDQIVLETKTCGRNSTNSPWKVLGSLVFSIFPPSHTIEKVMLFTQQSNSYSFVLNKSMLVYPWKLLLSRQNFSVSLTFMPYSRPQSNERCLEEFLHF